MQYKHTVGYLISADKASKHLTRSFLQRAGESLIDIVVLDGNTPLDQQADLHAIVHKCVGNSALEHRLEEFRLGHPKIPIIDAVDKIRILNNRTKALAALSDGGISVLAPHDNHIKSLLVGSPVQVALPKGTTCADALDLLDVAGLRLPFVVKSQQSNQHKVVIIKNLVSLQSIVTAAPMAPLQLPVILQQFIPHGSFISKVYVAGAGIVAVQRPTFEADQEIDEDDAGFVTLDRISGYPRPYPTEAPHQGSFPRAGPHSIADHSASNTCRIEVAADHVTGTSELSAGLANHVIGTGESSASLPDTVQHVKYVYRGNSQSVGTSAHQSPQIDQQQQQDNTMAPSSQSASEQSLPPPWLLTGLAATLRHNTGLQLFNFDLLSPSATSESHASSAGSHASSVESHASSAPSYYVIDINFFPGYEKLPNYEELLVSFLIGVLTNCKTDGGYGASSFLSCRQMGSVC